MGCSKPGFPVLHHLPEFAQIYVHQVSDATQQSPSLDPLLLLPSIFHSMTSSESALHIRWPKYWSFSLSISPSSEYSGLMSLGLSDLIFFLSKGLSRFFNTTVQRHQFFGAQPFFTVHLSYLYMTTGNTIALTTWTFVGKILSAF